MNIFLITLDSVRRDSFRYCLHNLAGFSELRNDFVYFGNCHSIYSETFLSHYTMFFGDFFGRSENDSLPRQLKKLGFAVRSFCNGDIFMRYPMNDSNYKHENFTRLSREEMILDLGTTPQFDWRADRYWETFNAYYGSADDVDRQMPEKWRDYLQTEVNDNNFIFLHFWMAHHPYGMGSLVGQNYGAIGKDLISRLERGEMSCGFVKNIYLQRVYDIINIHLRNLISVLKEKNIYNNSLIIITADHGEGLGDIGYGRNKFKICNMLKRLLSKIQIPCFNANSKSLYYKLDFNAFYHSGNHELQKEIPLLIKFPNSEFGGKEYNEMVTLFDLIPTINHYVNNQIYLKRDFGDSLYSILSKNYKSCDNDKLEKRNKIIKNIRYKELLESKLNQRLDYFPQDQPMDDLLYDNLIIGVNDYYSLGPGWHPLEDWPPCIRWTHKMSVAYLKKAKNSSQLCFKLYTGFKKNEVLIYLNDKNYREYELCPANFQIIRVPLIGSDEMKYLKVTLEVKETWIPDKVIKNGDLRSLGVAVERIWQE